MVNGVVAAATTTPFLSHGIRMQAAAEKLQIIIWVVPSEGDILPDITTIWLLV